LKARFRYDGLKLRKSGILALELTSVTISYAIRRFEEKAQKDQRLADIFHQTKSQLEIAKTRPHSYYWVNSAVKVAPPICDRMAENFTALRESLETHTVILSGPPSAEEISTL